MLYTVFLAIKVLLKHISWYVLQADSFCQQTFQSQALKIFSPFIFKNTHFTV